MAEEITKYTVETKTVEMLKTVFDPEIPVNIYDLGLIYKIEVTENEEAQREGEGAGNRFDLNVDMTLTAPNCPAADFILEDVHQKLESIHGVKQATVNLVFEPEWNKDMMSEEAKLDLGFM